MRALETLGGLIVAICLGIGFYRLTITVLRGLVKKKKENTDA